MADAASSITERQTSQDTTTVDDDVTAWRNLVLRRLLVCLLPVAMLTAGVLTRLYVIIDPRWMPLCIPQHGYDVIAFSKMSSYQNSSLANCTDYDTELYKYIPMRFTM